MLSLMSVSFAQTEKGGKENGSGAIGIVKESGVSYYPYERVLFRADALKMYARSNGFDTVYAFIINMGMRSNTQRFFIVNLKSMCVEKAGLVTHGQGDEKDYSGERQYSNKEGSKCTSLGKYAVGKSYQGFFGMAFKMEGLETSNSHAKGRKIVLHAMHCVPDHNVDFPICLSEGCPAVADAFLPEIKKIIDNAHRSVLLFIYDSNVLPVAKK